MRNSRIIVLVEVALAVALAVVFNFLVFFKMPMGGSITLVMLPIAVVALRRGAVAGAAAGALFGVIDFLLEPVFPVPISVLFDYPLPYLLLGLGIGLFSGPWRRAWAQSQSPAAGSPRRLFAARPSLIVVLAFVVGLVLRYLPHVYAGVVFWGEYASYYGFDSAIIYSLAYNAAYLAPAGAICLLATLLLLPILTRAVPLAPVRRNQGQAGVRP